MTDAEYMLVQLARASFLTSAPTLALCPAPTGHEVAFAGRSNAGKSSAINTLTGIHGLARTSRTPGRTQHLVVFDLDGSHRLVDLPGYGYAQVPQAMREQWGREMERYFRERQALAGLVLIMDCRHPLKDSDWQMLEACGRRGLPVLCLLTKADKLGHGAQQASLRQVRDALAGHGLPATVRLFSATRPVGLDALRAELAAWLFDGVPPAPDTETQ